MKKFIFSILFTLVALVSNAQMPRVDMGTSVEWATELLYDSLYRYGDMTAGDYYSGESTYRFYDSKTDGMFWSYTNKYGRTTTSIYNGGFADVPLSIAGNPEYDQAMNCLPDGWRLPTVSEVKELVENCTIISSTDKKYFIITSKINGNVIVLRNTGYITSIGEHKKNMHIMIGSTAIVEPRKYVSTLALDFVNDELQYYVADYCSLDKVTCRLPIWPVYSDTPMNSRIRTAPYNSETGDEDGTTYISTPSGTERRVKSYTSTGGVTSMSKPRTSGIYIATYTDGSTEKVLIK